MKRSIIQIIAAIALALPLAHGKDAVKPKDQEEKVTMTGTVDRTIGGAGDTIHVFVDGITGKRTVMPSLRRHLPSGVDLDSCTGRVEVTAVMWHRVLDGKSQVIMKSIKSVKKTKEVDAVKKAGVVAPAASVTTPTKP